MRNSIWLVLLLLFMGSHSSSAQKSAIYSTDISEFETAKKLYFEENYLAAQLLFSKIISAKLNQELIPDCSFYIADCGLRLNQPNAALITEKFITNFPTSSKYNLATKNLAQYYFNQGDYPKVLELMEKVDESSLSGIELERFYFQKGYAFFVEKNKKEATINFNKVERSKEFGVQANYYLGFMAYEGDDYSKATKYFDAISGEEKYKDKVSYFQADMNFKSGKFQIAIDLGRAAMANSNALEKSELNKIIGESYFNLNQFPEAIPYLKQYLGKKGKWNNTDYYQLGFAYYKQNDFENAITQFNKIIGGKDAIAQNAYYHLGESYLKTSKKQQALNAFKNASEMSFELKIQEDSYLNYAKLSYEIGNSYQNVPDVLASFIQKYPNSPSKPEIEGLLIDSFITSKNYKAALEFIEKNQSNRNKIAYQKVTFYRGLELFIDGNYQQALELFDKSIAIAQVPKFLARAIYWKAETEYVLDKFSDALLSYKQFLGSEEAKTVSEIKNSNYVIGYCYFKLKDYDQASIYFQNFITQSKDDKTRLSDAYLRLGDCYFVLAKYWPAMDSYNKVIEMKGVDADYAAFQKAISYGFIAKNEKKIEDLNKFVLVFSKSQYRDDALFELANTYVTENKSELAIKYYDQLINEYKSGIYTSKAILRQGLIYYNTEKDDLALVKLKKVVAEYSKSSEALEAVSTARIIYVENGKVAEYATWVKTLDFVQISDSELDNDTYESAEKQYLQNNTQKAIAGFSGYLNKFSNGIHALKANFYLAQLYFSEGLLENATSNYEWVIAQSKNEYTEPSLARLCEIFLKNNTSDKVILVLKRLETEADFPQNITFAQANLMKVYYEQKEYANAVVYADKVLNNPKTDDKVKSDGQIIIARSAINSGNEPKARAAYAKLLTLAKGELAAEALFYDAYFKNKDEKFEASNTIIQKLTKDYSGYKYFGAKGLIIMAKNFYELKDSFQATYILESVIKNFTAFPDVLEEAQKELDVINTEEAKTNSSIIK